MLPRFGLVVALLIALSSGAARAEDGQQGPAGQQSAAAAIVPAAGQVMPPQPPEEVVDVNISTPAPAWESDPTPPDEASRQVFESLSPQNQANFLAARKRLLGSLRKILLVPRAIVGHGTVIGNRVVELGRQSFNAMTGRPSAAVQSDGDANSNAPSLERRNSVDELLKYIDHNIFWKSQKLWTSKWHEREHQAFVFGGLGLGAKFLHLGQLWGPGFNVVLGWNPKEKYVFFELNHGNEPTRGALFQDPVASAAIKVGYTSTLRTLEAINKPAQAKNAAAIYTPAGPYMGWGPNMVRVGYKIPLSVSSVAAAIAAATGHPYAVPVLLKGHVVERISGGLGTAKKAVDAAASGLHDVNGVFNEAWAVPLVRVVASTRAPYLKVGTSLEWPGKVAGAAGRAVRTVAMAPVNAVQSAGCLLGKLASKFGRRTN